MATDFVRRTEVIQIRGFQLRLLLGRPRPAARRNSGVSHCARPTDDTDRDATGPEAIISSRARERHRLTAAQVLYSEGGRERDPHFLPKRQKCGRNSGADLGCFD